MRLINSIAVALLTLTTQIGCAQGQSADMQRPKETTSNSSRQIKRAEVEALITDAQAAPAEFAADTLLRLAESNMLPAGAQKRELLEEAFNRAAAAQQALPRLYTRREVDTKGGYLAFAFSLKLDALSLKARAVRAMLAVDKKRARTLFAEMSLPLPAQPLTCDEALVYDVRPFYDALKDVVQTTFSPAEKRLGLDVQFLTPYVEEVRSAAQIKPVAELIYGLHLPATQLPALLHTFSQALKKVADSDRAFSYWMTNHSVTDDIKLLASALERDNFSAQELNEAFREYLVKHLRAKRCADNIATQERSASGIRFVDYANQTLKFEQPISAEEIRPLKIEGRANPFPYWQSTATKSLLSSARALRFGAGQTPLTPAEKQTEDWQLVLNKFLNELEEWDEGQENSALEYFHQKCVLFQSLIDEVPAGASRNKVIVSYIAFLSNSPVQQDSRIEWLLHVKDLLRRARTAASGLDAKVLAALSKAGSPNLRLYADLENLTTPQKLSAAPKGI